MLNRPHPPGRSRPVALRLAPTAEPHERTGTHQHGARSREAGQRAAPHGLVAGGGHRGRGLAGRAGSARVARVTRSPGEHCEPQTPQSCLKNFKNPHAWPVCGPVMPCDAPQQPARTKMDGGPPSLDAQSILRAFERRRVPDAGRPGPTHRAGLLFSTGTPWTARNGVGCPILDAEVRQGPSIRAQSSSLV